MPQEHFYTSALATAAFLKNQAPGCSAYVIGEAGLLNALYDAGITMNDIDPDYVVVGGTKTVDIPLSRPEMTSVSIRSPTITASSEWHFNRRRPVRIIPQWKP